MPARKHDWDKLRDLFVEGTPDPTTPSDRTWMTLKELSERNKVPYQAVKQRSSKENWSDARVAYQVTLAKERQRSRAKELSKEAVEFDGKTLSVAKMGMNLVQARMAEISRKWTSMREMMEQDNEALKNGTIRPRDGLWSAINHKELDSLARAAEALQRLGRTALGEDVIRIQHEVDGQVEHTVTVRDRLGQDDADRIGRLLAALEDADLLNVATGIMSTDVMEEDIEDAEVVDEEDQPKQIGA